jgi:tetratricopeptide (TPR) repeat protein
MYFHDENEKAEEYLSKGANLNAKIGFKFVCALAHFFLGHNCFESGKWQKAEDNYRRTIEILESIKCLPSMANFCRICILLKDKSKFNESILNQLEDYVNSNNLKAFEGWMQRLIAKLIIFQGDEFVIEAETWIKRAIQSDTRNGTRWQLAKDYFLYSKILKQLDQSKKAESALKKAEKLHALCQTG